jgi:hypothetical protein
MPGMQKPHCTADGGEAPFKRTEALRLREPFNRRDFGSFEASIATMQELTNYDRSKRSRRRFSLRAAAFGPVSPNRSGAHREAGFRRSGPADLGAV